MLNSSYRQHFGFLLTFNISDFLYLRLFFLTQWFSLNFFQFLFNVSISLTLLNNLNFSSSMLLQFLFNHFLNILYPSYLQHCDVLYTVTSVNFDSERHWQQRWRRHLCLVWSSQSKSVYTGLSYPRWDTMPIIFPTSLYLRRSVESVHTQG